MKKHFFRFLILFSLVINISCVSKPLPIPGDRGRTIRTIYIEYRNRGNKYFSLEEYKNASEYYKLAMQNRKIYWACYYKLALCYVYSSDWTNAELMYKSMLKRDPENSSLQASLAYIYSMNGNVSQAIKLYSQMLQVQPNNESYLQNYLILILSDKKYFKKYRTSFEEVYERMNEFYPENSKLNRITEKYKELADIKESSEESSESAESSETAEGEETAENEEVENEDISGSEPYLPEDIQQ